MRWWAKVRSLWPFGAVSDGGEASAAIEQAELSHLRAARDRETATRLRVQTEAAADAVRAHNTANRYDDFLKQVIQGRE